MLFEKVMLELQCILSYAMPLTILRGNQMLELFISGLFFLGREWISGREV